MVDKNIKWMAERYLSMIKEESCYEGFLDDLKYNHDAAVVFVSKSVRSLAFQCSTGETETFHLAVVEDGDKKICIAYAETIVDYIQSVLLKEELELL